MDLKTLESKKISDLRVIAQSLGIDAGSLKKNELITAITGKNSPAPVEKAASVTEAAPVATADAQPEVRKRGRKPRIVVNDETPAVEEVAPVAEDTAAATTEEATTEEVAQ